MPKEFTVSSPDKPNSNLKSKMQPKRKWMESRSDAGAQGFTVVDLVTVLGVIAILLIVVLPALGRSQGSGSVARCLNNLRQFGAAWTMYSNDSQGELIESHPWRASSSGNRIQGVANPYSWAPGYAGMGNNQSYGNYPLHSPTNWLGLTKSVFYPYVNDPAPFRCPSDTRLFNGKPIVRSYAMNNWMNGGVVSSGFVLFKKREQILRPATMFVVIEEDPLTIDDSYFVTLMDGRGFVNIPGRRHNYGYTQNYADGHAEIRRIRNPMLMTVNSNPGGSGVAGTSNTEELRFHTNSATYPIGSWGN